MLYTASYVADTSFPSKKDLIASMSSYLLALNWGAGIYPSLVEELKLVGLWKVDCRSAFRASATIAAISARCVAVRPVAVLAAISGWWLINTPYFWSVSSAITTQSQWRVFRGNSSRLKMWSINQGSLITTVVSEESESQDISEIVWFIALFWSGIDKSHQEFYLFPLIPEFNIIAISKPLKKGRWL